MLCVPRSRPADLQFTMGALTERAPVNNRSGAEAHGGTQGMLGTFTMTESSLLTTGRKRMDLLVCPPPPLTGCTLERQLCMASM
eukprot:6074244-Prymnesium_polylepis.4